MAKKKHPPFLAVALAGNPTTGAPPILGEGGAIDVLSDRGFRLFMLLLERGHREKFVDNKGGTVGPRSASHTMLRRRFKWSHRIIKQTFEELEKKGYIRIESDGGIHGGIRRETQYRIGPAHPWVSQPTTHVGNAVVTHVGNGEALSGRVSLPTSVTRTNDVKPATAKAKDGKIDKQGAPLVSLPTSVRDLRSTMCHGFQKDAPEGYRIPADLPSDAVFFCNPTAGTWSAKFTGADRRPKWVSLDPIPCAGEAETQGVADGHEQEAVNPAVGVDSDFERRKVAELAKYQSHLERQAGANV